MLGESIQQDIPHIRQYSKQDAFHHKFSYDDYLRAHQWLDTIFSNGCFIPKDDNKFEESACVRCGGICCIDQTKLPEKMQCIATLAWNELNYFEDPEFEKSSNGHFICKRKNKKECNHKLIICKIHPFYPTKIHILEEECDFSAVLSSYIPTGRLCSNIKIQERQLKELSEFFRWLYGEFPENRLTYIANFAVQNEKEYITKEELFDAFYKGN